MRRRADPRAAADDERLNGLRQSHADALEQNQQLRKDADMLLQALRDAHARLVPLFYRGGQLPSLRQSNAPGSNLPNMPGYEPPLPPGYLQGMVEAESAAGDDEAAPRAFSRLAKLREHLDALRNGHVLDGLNVYAGPRLRTSDGIPILQQSASDVQQLPRDARNAMAMSAMMGHAPHTTPRGQENVPPMPGYAAPGVPPMPKYGPPGHAPSGLPPMPGQAPPGLPPMPGQAPPGLSISTVASQLPGYFSPDGFSSNIPPMPGYAAPRPPSGLPSYSPGVSQFSGFGTPDGFNDSLPPRPGYAAPRPPSGLPTIARAAGASVARGLPSHFETESGQALLVADLQDAVDAAAELEEIVRDQTRFIKAAVKRLGQLEHANEQLRRQLSDNGLQPMELSMNDLSLVHPDLSQLNLLGTSLLPPQPGYAPPGMTNASMSHSANQLALVPFGNVPLGMGSTSNYGAPGSLAEMEQRIANLERKNAYLSNAREEWARSLERMHQALKRKEEECTRQAADVDTMKVEAQAVKLDHPSQLLAEEARRLRRTLVARDAELQKIRQELQILTSSAERIGELESELDSKAADLLKKTALLDAAKADLLSIRAPGTTNQTVHNLLQGIAASNSLER